MTHCIMTDFTVPINVGSCRESITPLELKLLPGWKRHSGVLATYVWKSKPRTTLRVPLKDGKTYTYDTIARLFNEQLNISASGDPAATLSYKDSKVNLYVKDDTQLSNLKISEDIAEVLKIKCNTSNSGEPVDVDKIAINNTKNVSLVCDQIDLLLRQPHVSMNSFHSRNPCQQLAFAKTTINTSHYTLETIKATTCPYKESSADC